MVVWQRERLSLSGLEVQWPVILPVKRGRYSLLCEASLTQCPARYPTKDSDKQSHITYASRQGGVECHWPERAP
jgi:hypothetical protein